jgi:hypothetical protein
MITTVVDKKYLYKEARYLLSSIHKHMPNEKVCLFLINCDSGVQKDVQKWNENTIIIYKKINIPREQYKSYMYVMMTFVFDWLLSEVKIEEDIIYLDADIVLKGGLHDLYSELNRYDLMFRYHPFRRIQGPTSKEYGGIMNNGCIAMKNNSLMAKYSKKLKQNIKNYLDTGKDPVLYVEKNEVITCIDQEMVFITYLEMSENINFFPIDDIFNDTHFTSFGIVWHAKGVHRSYPEYLIECCKYGRKEINLTKEYLRLYYRNLKKFIKGFLIEPAEDFYIKELKEILNSIEVKSTVIVNSNFYLDNRDLLKNKNIECYDTDPVVYYKNIDALQSNNISHNYIVYDTQNIDSKDIDLLIVEQRNLRVISKLNCKNKILKS